MSYDLARHRIDDAHRADPAGAELTYADRMEAWILRLDPHASPLLRLAARCQHLERWTIPRASYPMDRVGYLTWRKQLYHTQANRAKTLLLESGVAPDEAEHVATWVSKTALTTNPGSQALEDAACLVFLADEIGQFAATHADYTTDKYLAIIRKTWAKMSERGHELARTIPFPPAIAALVQQALNP